MAPESNLDRVASFRDIEALEKLLIQHFEAHDREHVLIDRARVESAISMDKRLDAMNEIRNALRDQSATLFTRPEHQLYEAAITEKIESLQLSRAELTGKASQSNLNVTMFLAIAAIIIALFNLVAGFIRK